VTVADAIVKAEERKPIGPWDNRANPDLFEALIALGRRGSAINPVLVGNYLSSELENVVALEDGQRVRFENPGKYVGVNLWVLVDVDSKDRGSARWAPADPDDVLF
jgi:hypothetical protein